MRAPPLNSAQLTAVIDSPSLPSPIAVPTVPRATAHPVVTSFSPSAPVRLQFFAVHQLCTPRPASLRSSARLCLPFASSHSTAILSSLT